MDNNNYNSFNGNDNGNNYGNNNGNSYGNDNGNSTGNGSNAESTSASSQQESSSTYSYNYTNQENKNPYTVWRAEENTANTGGAQSQADSYSNIYGNPNTANSWTNYTEAKKQKKEERARKRAQRAANANPNFGIKLAKCASIALVFGLVAGTAFEGSSYLMSEVLGTNEPSAVSTTNPGSEKDAATEIGRTEKTAITTSVPSGMDISGIVEECMPSIVAITNLSQVQLQNFFGQIQNYEVPSAGSGILIDEDNDYLYIATNNHVVESAANSRAVNTETTLTIQFCDNTTASAEVKGTDRSSDLAVVKVKKADVEKDTLSKIKIASFGDSDNVKIGSQAIAIGNALGYGQAVTGGWVSALNREVTIQDDTTGESFTNELIQTDAAINPGNSGGALLNSSGEVIGINSSKYSDTDVEGMGFAIPANTAKPIIEDLIEREVVSDDKAAFLGIIGVDVTSSVAKSYNIPEGICVTEVTRGTPAETYGLQKGDIITKFDGKAVKSLKSLQNMLKYYEADTKVDITLQRMGDGGYQEQTISVVLGKKNS